MAEEFELMMCYPAEGEGAFVELWYDGAVWAELQLENLSLGDVAEQRTADAWAAVVVYFPRRFGQHIWRFALADAPAQLERLSHRKRWWPFDVGAALAQLEHARDLLLENERDRDPQTDSNGLTAAGAAFSKMSRQAQARFLNDPGSHLHPDGDEDQIPAEDEPESPGR